MRTKEFFRHLTPYGQWLLDTRRSGRQQDFFAYRKTAKSKALERRADGYIRGLTADKWTPEDLHSLLPDDYRLIDGDVRQSPKETQAEYAKRCQRWEEAQLKKAVGAAIDTAKALQNWYPSAGIYITYNVSGLCPPFGIELRHYGTTKKEKPSFDHDPMLATL